jgi:hypothetical protein
MTSTTARIIAIAFAFLAIAAPLASAAPMRDGSPAIRTGSLAGTTDAPKQDLRNADNRPPIYVSPVPQHHPKIANVYVPPVPQQPQTMAPATHTQSKPVAAEDDGPSPLVFIVPSLVLVAMFGAGIAFARMPRRSPA